MRLKSESGSNIIEMALVLPLLLLIVFGIVEFSLALYDKAMITNASREGARSAVVYRVNAAGQPVILDQAQVQSVVNNYLASRLVTFGGSTAATTQVVAPGAYVPGSSYAVTVSYNYQFLVLPAFLLSGNNAITITAQTIMRME